MDFIYTELVEHYENCLNRYGNTPQGVDWPNDADLKKRHNIMLDVISPNDLGKKINIIDLGCGYGSFYQHIQLTKQANQINYLGLDASHLMIQSAASLNPTTQFERIDILNESTDHLEADYVIMNGLFTEKRNLTWHQMHSFLLKMIEKAFSIAKKGIAFNVMQYHVDWSNPQLFHCSYDLLAEAIIASCSRHFKFRTDYGLYEYTAYVYHQPNEI